MALTAVERRDLLRLARAALEAELTDGEALARARRTVALTPALLAPRATFVTLHAPAPAGRGRDAVLRGCIGTLTAEHPLHESVVKSAVAAAFQDPRFPPVGPGELDHLEVSVSALTPTVPVESPDAIVPGVHGVLLERGGARSVFLPQVAIEQGWGRQELLEHLSRKAGLPPDAWRDARLAVFEAEVFGERD